MIAVVALVDLTFFFGVCFTTKFPDLRLDSFCASADTFTALIFPEQRIQKAILTFSLDGVFLQRAFPSLQKSFIVMYDVSSSTGVCPIRYSAQIYQPEPSKMLAHAAAGWLSQSCCEKQSARAQHRGERKGEVAGPTWCTTLNS